VNLRAARREGRGTDCRESRLRQARDERDADVILLNTCSVREKAAHEVFARLGQLGRHKTARPWMILGVCGCGRGTVSADSLIRDAPEASGEAIRR